jgi:hypothetical protein
MTTFQPFGGAFSANTTAVCIGSGRFLVRAAGQCVVPLPFCQLTLSLGDQRAVLVPTLRAAGSGVVVAQTRGMDFAEWCAQQQGKYEVDTIQKDGSVQTQEIQLEGKRGEFCDGALR